MPHSFTLFSYKKPVYKKLALHVFYKYLSCLASFAEDENLPENKQLPRLRLSIHLRKCLLIYLLQRRSQIGAYRCTRGPGPRKKSLVPTLLIPPTYQKLHIRVLNFSRVMSMANFCKFLCFFFSENIAKILKIFGASRRISLFIRVL